MCSYRIKSGEVSRASSLRSNSNILILQFVQGSRLHKRTMGANMGKKAIP